MLSTLMGSTNASLSTALDMWSKSAAITTTPTMNFALGVGVATAVGAIAAVVAVKKRGDRVDKKSSAPITLQACPEQAAGSITSGRGVDEPAGKTHAKHNGASTNGTPVNGQDKHPKTGQWTDLTRVMAG
jgi:hypothetical protein